MSNPQPLKDRPGWRLYQAAFVALILGVMAIALTAWLVQSLSRARFEVEFDKDASQFVGLLRQRLAQQFGRLRRVEDWLLATPNPTQERFSAMAWPEMLRPEQPALLALGWARLPRPDPDAAAAEGVAAGMAVRSPFGGRSLSRFTARNESWVPLPHPSEMDLRLSVAAPQRWPGLAVGRSLLRDSPLASLIVRAVENGALAGGLLMPSEMTPDAVPEPPDASASVPSGPVLLIASPVFVDGMLPHTADARWRGLQGVLLAVLDPIMAFEKALQDQPMPLFDLRLDVPALDGRLRTVFDYQDGQLVLLADHLPPKPNADRPEDELTLTFALYVGNEAWSLTLSAGPGAWRDVGRSEVGLVVLAGSGMLLLLVLYLAVGARERRRIRQLAQTVEGRNRDLAKEIADREQAERRLFESETRYRALVESSPDAILVSQNKRIAYANVTARSVLGLKEDMSPVGMVVRDFFDDDTFEKMPGDRIPGDRKPPGSMSPGSMSQGSMSPGSMSRGSMSNGLKSGGWAGVGAAAFSRSDFAQDGTDAPAAAKAARKNAGGSGAATDSVVLVDRVHRVDGSRFQAEIIATRIIFNTMAALLIVVRDISDRQKLEQDVRLAASVFEATAEGIVITDADNRIRWVNPAFTGITGYRPDEVIDQNPSLMSSGRHDTAFYGMMWHHLSRDGHWEGEVWNRRKNGEVFPVWLSISALKDGNDRITHYTAIFSDISRRKEAEAKIYFQANFDGLTGLPNRSLFKERLNLAVNRAHQLGRRCAVLFVDLDRFKVVNDTFGHAAGDLLLVEAAQRLRQSVRDQDVLARFGGDEFTIIVSDITDASQAADTAMVIMKRLRDPFDIQGSRAFVGASIGITIAPDDDSDPEHLLRNADIAMYRAKERGKSTFQFFTLDMDTEVADWLTIESELHTALEQNELEVYYQPIVDSLTRMPVAAEALLRWRHRDRGLVLPQEFLSVAEASDLIVEIGRWVLETACQQAHQWGQAWHPIQVSVNVAERQLMQGQLPNQIKAALLTSGLDPRRLDVELTENIVVAKPDDLLPLLVSTKALGVRLAIDDFGTGFTSLQHLRSFPIDTIKIDRSFVSGLGQNDRDDAITLAILGLGNTLGLNVVAEGVETVEQERFLRANDCHEFQGFRFSVPVTAAEFQALLGKPL